MGTMCGIGVYIGMDSRPDGKKKVRIRSHPMDEIWNSHISLQIRAIRGFNCWIQVYGVSAYRNPLMKNLFHILSFLCLADAAYADHYRLAIIKYSHGGTNLYSQWSASGEMYATFTGPPWTTAKESNFATFAAKAPSSDADPNSATSILSNSGHTAGGYASFYIRDIDGFTIFSTSATPRTPFARPRAIPFSPESTT